MNCWLTSNILTFTALTGSHPRLFQWGGILREVSRQHDSREDSGGGTSASADFAAKGSASDKAVNQADKAVLLLGTEAALGHALQLDNVVPDCSTGCWKGG